jgi:hypothetical protein
MLFVLLMRLRGSSRHQRHRSIASLVCREHRLASTFLEGPSRPEVGVVAAVLFLLRGRETIRGF